MSDDNPANIPYDIWSNFVSPLGPSLDKMGVQLEQILAFKRSYEGRNQRITIVGGDGRTPAFVRGMRSRSAPEDPSLIVQASPNQMPLPVQAAPLGASCYQYYGYATAAAGFTFIGVPITEIFANTTTPSIVCTSANDSLAGTGLNKIVIQYYDQNLRGPFFQIINLNGLTAVNFGPQLLSPLCYIEQMYGIEAGGLFVAAGNIQLWSNINGTGSNMGQINTGDTKTAWCRHYIPPGITSYITNMSLSLSNAGIINGVIGSTPNLNSGQTGKQNIGMETYVTGVIGGNQGFQYNFPTPIAVVGPGRFYMQGFASITTGNMWGTMGFYDLPTGALPGYPNPILPGNPSVPFPYQLVTTP